MSHCERIFWISFYIGPPVHSIVQISCPIQHNGIDCGLFTVVIWLHIFNGAPINQPIFAQEHTMKLRNILLSMFPCLMVVTSQNMPDEAIHKFSNMKSVIPPATIKLIVGGTIFKTIQTTHHPLPSCRILGLTAFNSLLQYVNWLVWEVCSVN